ncbi:MAG: tRNA dihydrouridine(20/20a) synthase DusA, partial [Pseudomonadota bacterium]
RDRLIGFSDIEHPVALQLGGNDPVKLAQAARIGEAFGYDEVNLNCGCPSDRVQSGAFGACLMREPQRVADCVRAMADTVSIPVTVKCRVAVDDDPPKKTLFEFVETVAEAGCTTFTVHARKAWLKGLSPKENREIPPLDYGLVADLKAARPDLTIILNGGLLDLMTCAQEMTGVDGVMLGRAAYQTPALLLGVDAWLETGRVPAPPDTQSLIDAVERFKPYLADRLSDGTSLHAMTRHMLGLFAGRPGARGWRRILSQRGPRPGAGLEVIDAALEPVFNGLIEQGCSAPDSVPQEAGIG